MYVMFFKEVYLYMVICTYTFLRPDLIRVLLREKKPFWYSSNLAFYFCLKDKVLIYIFITFYHYCTIFLDDYIWCIFEQTFFLWSRYLSVLCREIENTDSGFFNKRGLIDDFCYSLSQLCISKRTPIYGM